MDGAKLFDIIDVKYTDTERAVTICINKQSITMKLEPTPASVTDNRLWILNQRQLDWIYKVWPDTSENAHLYSTCACMCFARVIGCHEKCTFKLPIEHIDFDKVCQKLRGGQRIEQIFDKFIVG